MYTARHYIDGMLATGGPVMEVENPATQKPCGTFTEYTSEMTDQALAAAKAGFKIWSKTPLEERVVWMNKLAVAIESRRDELIELLIAETGKPMDIAEYDFGMLVRCLRYFSEEVQRLHGEIIPDQSGNYTHQLIRQPVGVVVAFLAWNFPLLNLGYKLGPILASGCSCVIKPSALTPLATARVGEIIHEAGLPKGVINIVIGTDHETGARLVQSKIPALITMIGSTAAGRTLIKASSTSIKRFSLELGGNAPVIVYPDFNPELAAQRIVALKCANSGQVCVSPNRCFVHRSVLDCFLDAARNAMQAYHFGAGFGEEPRMGPLASCRQLDSVLGKVDRAVGQGARLLQGGRRITDGDRASGYYMEPTLMLCDRDLEICKDEIFGPVLAVIPFDDQDDIIAIANDCEYGLAAYVFTSDFGRAQVCAEELDYGSICINEPFYSVELPHGGLKQSGIGKDCSRLSLEEYYDVKRVTFRK